MMLLAGYIDATGTSSMCRMLPPAEPPYRCSAALLEAPAHVCKICQVRVFDLEVQRSLQSQHFTPRLHRACWCWCLPCGAKGSQGSERSQRTVTISWSAQVAIASLCTPQQTPAQEITAALLSSRGRRDIHTHVPGRSGVLAAVDLRGSSSAPSGAAADQCARTHRIRRRLRDSH